MDASRIQFREAGGPDMRLLVDMRVRFARELQACDDPAELDALIRKTEEYFRTHLTDNTYIGFLGFYGDEAVCCAGLLVYALPPLVGKLDRTQGHLLNFYTVPQYRKMGAGTALLEFIILKSREHGLHRIFLNATRDGERIYGRSGFTGPDEKAMILYL
jgi:GNAT superfamily N-acetyltransferase